MTCLCTNGEQTRTEVDPATNQAVEVTMPCPICRPKRDIAAYWRSRVIPAHWAEWDRLNNELEAK